MEINHPQTLAEVTRAFDRYQQAIIDNDISVLNELFWNHALTLRYGTGENLYGHAEIASYRGNDVLVHRLAHEVVTKRQRLRVAGENRRVDWRAQHGGDLDDSVPADCRQIREGELSAEEAGKEDAAIAAQLLEIKAAVLQLTRRMYDPDATRPGVKLAAFQVRLFDDIRQTFDHQIGDPERPPQAIIGCADQGVSHCAVPWSSNKASGVGHPA